MADPPSGKTLAVTLMTRPNTANAIAMLALVTLAFFVYRPTAPAVLDYVDFPEIVRTASSGSGFTGAYRQLAAVQDTMGRWSPVLIASHSAQWSAFGWNAIPWHIVRFLVMCCATLLAFLLYRRLGLEVLGGFAAASLLVVAPGAAMGWTRLSTPEPIGLIFLLGAAYFATNPSSRASRWAIAVMCLGAVWSKEMMVASLLLPVLIAVFALEGSGGARFRELVRTFTPTALVMAIGVVPTLHAFLGAPATAFATQYGSSNWSRTEFMGGFVTALIPFSPGSSASEPSPAVPLIAWLLLLAVGWSTAVRRDPNWARPALAIAVLLPLAGAVVYAPWPYYQLIYALPYLAAGALLVGVPVSALVAEGRWHRVLAVGAGLVIITYGAMQAANDASRTRSVQRAFAATVNLVAEKRDVDSALVAVHIEQFNPAGNFGVRFGRYARALKLPWPQVRDIRCDDIPRPVPPRTLVVVMSEMCPLSPDDRVDVAVARNRYHWPDPRPRADTVSVTVLGASP